ncbi:Asp23/Gls24 family envelope stress response protein [Streptomyces sp. NBC_01005]|nr:Asp23/Gls24 family envelope stress response protein [Streptomyces sp. NBC_01005]WTC98555.1 Asp23/Gls24 family envelope stress response protein [Streptomyces sp. NBC_01650]
MTSDLDRRPGVPRRERGATTVSDHAVAKIASHVAREALSRFTDSARRVPPGHRTPRVTTSVRRAPERNEHAAGRVGDTAHGRPDMLGEVRMRIAVELGYPSDIGAQCAAVRREVIEQLGTWAGMDVSELTVSVERLHSVHSRNRDRERVR